MTINDLKAYGANLEEGLSRCMNNESFYLRLVKMIPGDDNFRKLKEALEGYCYRKDGEDTDKSGGLDHISDAAAYLLCYLKPIRRSWGLNRPKVYGF